MRVAWFRAGHSPNVDTVDSLSAGLAALSAPVAVDFVPESHAHDFVIEQAHRPYDACVFEVRNDPGSDYIWAYLFQYPGILLLQDRSLHDSRTRALERHHRGLEYAREFEFNHGHRTRGAGRAFPRGTWPMLRAPMLASRLVGVTDEERRSALERACPESRIRVIPPSAAPPAFAPSSSHVEGDAPLRVAAVSRSRRAAISRAIDHAREAGVPVSLLQDASHTHPDADVVICLDPLDEEPSLTPAIAAMAHSKAVIVFEREATAVFPALDPQTWRPRDPFTRLEPVVISIDPRDEEHSLGLALKALARDRDRGLALGKAARAWWQAHATPEHAARVWRGLLEEAGRTSPPTHPTDWPAHLNADGTELGRAIAAEMGIAFGFF